MLIIIIKDKWLRRFKVQTQRPLSTFLLFGSPNYKSLVSQYERFQTQRSTLGFWPSWPYLKAKNCSALFPPTPKPLATNSSWLILFFHNCTEIIDKVFSSQPDWTDQTPTTFAPSSSSGPRPMLPSSVPLPASALKAGPGHRAYAQSPWGE